MRYKNEDANRYRVNFMIATEKLMDKLTVREFISYLEEKAELKIPHTNILTEKWLNVKHMT